MRITKNLTAITDLVALLELVKNPTAVEEAIKPFKKQQADMLALANGLGDLEKAQEIRTEANRMLEIASREADRIVQKAQEQAKSIKAAAERVLDKARAAEASSKKSLQELTKSRAELLRDKDILQTSVKEAKEVLEQAPLKEESIRRRQEALRAAEKELNDRLAAFDKLRAG